MALMAKNPPVNAEDVRDAGSIPGLGRSPGGGHGTPLQYSCWENPMDRGAWQATVHGVVKSWTWQSVWAHTHIVNSWWECKMVQPLRKSVWKLIKSLIKNKKLIKKLKIELLYVSAISLLGIYQKNWKHDLRDICTPMFTAVLFTIVKK